MDLKNTKIRVKNQEESIKIQEYAFSQGYSWLGKKFYRNTNEPYRNTNEQFLYFNDTDRILYGSIESYFLTDLSKEIFIEDIFSKIHECW